MRANYNSRAASCTEKCTQNTSYPPLIEVAAELWFPKTLHTQQYNDFLLLCVTSFGLDSRLIGGGRELLPENVDGQRLHLGSDKRERASSSAE